MASKLGTAKEWRLMPVIGEIVPASRTATASNRLVFGLVRLGAVWCGAVWFCFLCGLVRCGFGCGVVSFGLCL